MLRQTIEEHTFSSAEELFNALSPWGENRVPLDGFVFRGHSRESYQLIPSVLREEAFLPLWNSTNGLFLEGEQRNFLRHQISMEWELVRRFYKLSDRRGLDVPVSDMLRESLASSLDFKNLTIPKNDRFWLPPGLYEVAALAQHYGIPTRLLDWTYDHNVALYFALDGAVGVNCSSDENIVVWALNVQEISIRSLTTNSSVGVKFITPHYASNPNINAQQGLFTHMPVMEWGIDKVSSNADKGVMQMVDRVPLDQVVLNKVGPESVVTIMKKLVIPASIARESMIILDKMGYGPARIFPGYGGVAKEVMNKYALYKMTK